MHPDYYQILHVHPDADPEIIKASYRTLMQKLKKHPDLGGDINQAALINKAYAVLKDDRLRKLYDKGLLPEKDFQEEDFSRSNSTKDSHEKIVCPFCKKANFLGLSPSEKEQHCFSCKNPLRFIDFDPEWVGHRAVRSVKENTEIAFSENSQPSKIGRGVLEDLSPTGMRFVSRSQLRMGDIIKIENGELTGVASVMRSYQDNDADKFVTAVKFLSLKIFKTRGAFVSHKV